MNGSSNGKVKGQICTRAAWPPEDACESITRAHTHTHGDSPLSAPTKHTHTHTHTAPHRESHSMTALDRRARHLTQGFNMTKTFTYLLSLSLSHTHPHTTL